MCVWELPKEGLWWATLSLFLAGNSTPTIPHKFRKQKSSWFSAGIWDTAAVDGQLGSNAYEVNPLPWQFERGKQRLGGLSVASEETYDRKDAALQELIVRWAETCWHRKADWAEWEMNCGCEQSIYKCKPCMYI
jgi:hypothetical protein